MEDQRRNPDKLLKKVNEEERHEKQGKLKIYLGAAPGVGKTHEMLHDAFEERKKKLDVVIGVIESHGRKDIESMLNYFEILPKNIINYHGKDLSEFDIDNALKRHPALILMDEMAHTNAAGSRHKKRWQDIKELLDKGIDVYTTINIQHIESLNDDVSQIIHAPVKETVPDSMIERAETIELVDLSPEELLKRLEQGKVYVPEQANLAVENFFRKGNLIALRELALRTMANRVGAQVLLYRQDQGIKHIWPTKEKILVCVGSSPASIKLIQSAKQMATHLQAEWIAVHVDTPRVQPSEEERSAAVKNLRLAEQLGAQTRILNGFDIVSELMTFAREQNVTQIMVWKNIRKRWWDLFHRNLVDEIVRYSGEIDVYIMTGSLNVPKPKKPKPAKSNTSWRSYIFSLGVVGIATAIDFLLFPYLKTSNLIMVYLLGVTIVALLGEISVSIIATVLSVLAYDFFFIQPYYSFEVSDIEYFFTMVIMLIVAYVISHLTILTRRQADAARLTEKQTSALYTLSRQLASTRGIDKLLTIGITYIADLFDSEVLALMPIDNHLVIRARSRTNQILDKKEQSVAEWVYELGQMAGLGTDTLSFSEALYLPLLGSQSVIGVLRIRPLETERLLLPQQFQLLEACANQIATALEVDRLSVPRGNHA